MIITRKAALGFVLLALIVFLTTKYTITNMHGPPSNNNAFTGKSEPDTPNVLKHEPTSYMQYQPPVFKLGGYAPVVVTIVIELFTLGCYLVLKKHEPAINEYAADIMNQFKQ